MEHSENYVANLVVLRSSANNMLPALTDQRAARGMRYAWLPLFTIALLAKLASANTPIELADVLHRTRTEMRSGKVTTQTV